MKKSIYKVISYIIIIAIVIVVSIYVDEEVYGYIENLAIDDSIEKEEYLVVDENENQIENCVVEGDSEDMELTKEYVCSEFGIDEAEFEGVDFEDFVGYYDLSYDTIHSEAVAYLLKRYREDLGKVKIPDYHEEFQNCTKGELTKKTQENIAILIFAYNVEDENKYHIFDFNIEKIMVGSGTESHVYEKNIVGEADNFVKDEILELFEKYNVYLWNVKRQAYDNPGATDGSAYWNLKVKFTDSTIWGIYGELMDDVYAPEDLDLFVEDLKALAASSATENS